MDNFECIGGPFAGSRLACKFKPYEGAREVVYHFEDGVKLEAFYELRRHQTVELITGEGVWQWHYVPPNAKVEADGAASCAGRASNDGLCAGDRT